MTTIRQAVIDVRVARLRCQYLRGRSTPQEQIDAAARLFRVTRAVRQLFRGRHKKESK